MNLDGIKSLLKNPVLYQAVGTILGGGAIYYVGYQHGRKVMRNQAIEAFVAHEKAQAMIIPATRVEMDAEEVAWNELAKLRDQVGEEMFEEVVEVTKANAQMDRAEPSENVLSIFKSEDAPEWVWQDELKIRAMNAGPYIITKEEYLDNDGDELQQTATWYEMDRTLVADDGNEVIFNWPDRLGDLRFGHGSQDPNVVYIRNPDEGIEWEVMFHSGSASEEVLGIAPGEPSNG